MVRYATIEDAAVLHQLESTVFPGQAMPEELCRRELSIGRCWIDDGRGYVLTRWGHDIVDILRLGVVPEHQKKGLGRYLLRMVIIHAERPIMLTVRWDNNVALRLYKREGFRPVAFLPTMEALILRR